MERPKQVTRMDSIKEAVSMASSGQIKSNIQGFQRSKKSRENSKIIPQQSQQSDHNTPRMPSDQQFQQTSQHSLTMQSSNYKYSPDPMSKSSYQRFKGGKNNYLLMKQQLQQQQQQQQIEREQRLYNQKLHNKLKSLAGVQGFDIPVFSKGNDNINVEFDQVNNAMNVIDLSKRGQLKKMEKNLYDPKCTQKVTMQQMKQRTHAINKDYNISEINNLFPNKGEISSIELLDFLKDNQINDQTFPEGDPMELAIKLFLKSDGSLHFEKLSQVMESLGYGELSQKDVNVIKEFVDVDDDGIVSLKDLTSVFSRDSYEYMMVEKSKNKEMQELMNNKAAMNFLGKKF